MKLPSPDQRYVIKTFLAESTNTYIDAVEFEKLASGCAMIVHYRDARGFAHRKRMESPDARNDNDVTDLVVLFSEWLGHGTTKLADAQVVAGHA